MGSNDALIRARTERGLDTGEIANLVGVNTHTYIKWEKRKIRPSLRHIRRLCEIFQARPKDLGYDEFE